MTALLDAVILRSRAVLSIMAVLALAGLYAYFALPREALPDPDLPVFTITIAQEGTSAEDAERLLVKPVEGVLRGLDGIKELTSIAAPGRATLIAEFDSRADRGHALAALREQLAAAKVLLPADAQEPVIEDSNPGALPAISVALSGNLPERTLQRYARRLKERIETVPGVLSADLIGDRPEVLEAIVDPARLQSYAVSEAELVALVTQNSRPGAAGNVETDRGRLSVNALGLFGSVKDILALPVKVAAEGVVTLRDVAELRRTFKDATSISRVNGKAAIVLQVAKRRGANIVTVSRAVREEVAAARREWPASIKTQILFDESRRVGEMFGSLEGNMLSAVFLVVVLTALALGLRGSMLVGLSIPLSVLIGFLGLALIGVTVNGLVLFGLVLAACAVADRAIMVVEYAERKIGLGTPRGEAYRLAAAHMAWPMITATAAVLAIYVPMLFWPGVGGKAISALPITAIAVLAASLFAVVVALPALGALGAGNGLLGGDGETDSAAPAELKLRSLPAVAMLEAPKIVTVAPLTASRTGAKRPPRREAGREHFRAKRGPIHAQELRRNETLEPRSEPTVAETMLANIMAWYADLLRRAISHPVTVLGLALGLAVLVATACLIFGRGVAVFPDSEPEEAVVQIFGRGNLSAREQLDLVKLVEAQLLPMDGLRTVLAVSGTPAGQAGSARPDQIGQITVAFEDHGKRPDGRKLLEAIRERTGGLPGVQVEVRKRETGLPGPKPLRLEVSSGDRQTAIAAATVIRRHLDDDRQLRDVEDTRPVPGIEWALNFDRAEAARVRADIGSVGAALQMITKGMLIGTYRPVEADAEDEIEIRARFPIDERGIGQLDRLTVRTAAGRRADHQFRGAQAAAAIRRPRAQEPSLHGLARGRYRGRRARQGQARRAGCLAGEAGLAKKRELSIPRRGRGRARGVDVPGAGYARRAVPDLRHPGGAVRQLLSDGGHAGDGAAFRDRRAHRHACQRTERIRDHDRRGRSRADWHRDRQCHHPDRDVQFPSYRRR